jgi:hypothetical protein
VGGKDPTLAARFEYEREEITKVRNIPSIQFGCWAIDAWYFAPFPDMFHEHKLFICEFCLKVRVSERTRLCWNDRASRESKQTFFLFSSRIRSTRVPLASGRTIAASAVPATRLGSLSMTTPTIAFVCGKSTAATKRCNPRARARLSSFAN